MIVIILVLMGWPSLVVSSESVGLLEGLDIVDAVPHLAVSTITQFDVSRSDIGHPPLAQGVVGDLPSLTQLFRRQQLGHLPPPLV